MANPRLPFLYPNLFRSIKSCEPNTWRSIRTSPSQKRCLKASLHTSQRRAQETFPHRYGPAAGEPRLPPPSKPSEPLFSNQQESQNEAAKSEREVPEAKSRAPNNTEPEAKPSQPETQQAESSEEKAKAKLAHEQETPFGPTEALDTVLQIPTPSEEKGKQEKHPHLEASPYEHHFDTYTLVQDLRKHGFTEDQAVTLMKAIRLMLAENLDLAKEGLVSKSDTENETYLFRAACSELRTTIQASRHTEAQRQRTQRAQLTHEADILNQKMTQDLLTLKEEMKAMFHNRKMAVQEDKRNLDGRISELNYKITVLLNGDAKSDVESLRWVLTRRAAMAIGFATSERSFCAFHDFTLLTNLCSVMVLFSLNYAGHVSRQRAEEERKRKAAKKAIAEKAEARYTTASRASGTQTDNQPANYEESLG